MPGLKAAREDARARARELLDDMTDDEDRAIAAPKHLVSLRLDPDVVERFRATGPGWQTLINEVLREHLPKIPG